MALNDQDGYFGEREAPAGNNEYNALLFTVQQILANCSHAALVRVVSSDNDGDLATAGTVDVQPMVNQLDGQGNSIPHGVVNGLIYLRIQGGTNAVIIDPQPGDIGLAVFADRDISSVVAQRDIANPGSARRSDMADGIYLGGVLNSVPTQFVRFSPDGIEIVSPTLVKLSAPDVLIETERLVINASESVLITTPQFKVVGESTLDGPTTMTETAVVEGLASLNAGFAALPRSGGGASTINGAVSISGDVDTTGTLTNNGKPAGSTHTHRAQGATAITTPPL